MMVSIHCKIQGSTWQRLFTNSYNSTFYYVAGLIIESLTAMFWWQIKSDLFLLWRLSIMRPFYLDGDCTYIYKLRFLTLIVKHFTRKYHQCWCILFSVNPWIYQLSAMFLIFDISKTWNDLKLSTWLNFWLTFTNCNLILKFVGLWEWQ